MNTYPPTFSPRSKRQQGFSLIVVLLILVIVSIVGVASMQMIMMGERSARNDRDTQLAWQAAEAALVDAEIDLSGPNTSTASRTMDIKSTGPGVPDSGCVEAGSWRGFCNISTDGTSKPSWLAADLADGAAAVPLGTYTGRTFANAGDALGVGIQPALPPRYIIEEVTDEASASGGGRMVGSTYGSAASAASLSKIGRSYRITSIGFGPRKDIQVVMQTVYRN